MEQHWKRVLLIVCYMATTTAMLLNYMDMFTGIFLLWVLVIYFLQ